MGVAPAVAGEPEGSTGVDTNGTVAEGFEPVREAFVRNFEVLGDRGAAVAVYRDGH